MKNNLLIIVVMVALSACASIGVARRDSITEIQERRKLEDRSRYQALLKAKVRRSLKSPYECKGSGVVRFAVKIDSAGNITQTHYVGDPRGQDCIKNVEQAIRDAAPFPAPPAALYDEAINEGFLIKYDFKEYKEWKAPGV